MTYDATYVHTSFAGIAKDTRVCARIRLPVRMYKNPGEEISSSDDGNGTAAAVAAVADVAIPSASCYFLQRFSVLLSHVRRLEGLSEETDRVALSFGDFV